MILALTLALRCCSQPQLITTKQTYQKPNADADRYDPAPSSAMILHHLLLSTLCTAIINLVYLFYWNGNAGFRMHFVYWNGNGGYRMHQMIFFFPVTCHLFAVFLSV